MNIEIKKNKGTKEVSSSGVTLIELLVAVSIFAITMTVVSGIFVSAIKGQQKIFAKQAVVDNARYAMEFMVKELRMARSITTNGSSCPGGNCSSIAFTNSANDSITYSLAGGKITRNDSTLGTGDQPISSDEIAIGANGLNFHINNWDLTAGPAPVITIYIKAEKAAFSQSGYLELQTSVSPRLY